MLSLLTLVFFIACIKTQSVALGYCFCVWATVIGLAATIYVIGWYQNKKRLDRSKSKREF